jgi:hypothetical protein
MENKILSLPHNWIYGYFTHEVDDTGKRKKGYDGFNKNWTKSRAESEMEQDKYQGTDTFGILRQIPLEGTGLIVIDIDEDCTFREVYELFPCLRNTLFVEGNTKGWHFSVYCDYNTKDMVDCLEGIKGDIIVKQIFEREGKKWSPDPIKTISIEELSQMLKHGKSLDDEPKTDTETDIEYGTDTETEKTIDTEQTVNPNEFREYIKHNLLPFDGSWDDWRNIGFGLFHTFGEDGLPLFIEFSKQNKQKYNSTNTIKFYNSIKPTTKRPISFGTIRKFAAKKDKTLFKNIMKLFDKEIKETAENDNEASKIILRNLQDKLLYANTHYYKMDNVWINDKETINSALMTYIMDLPLWKPIGNTKETLYWANFPAAEKLAKCVLQKMILEPTDYNKFHTTMKYRLCFKNGIFDIKEKKFYTWNEVDFECYPVIQIPYYYKKGDPTIGQEIFRKVLEPLFGEQLHLAMKYLARSLAGCTEDKNFATYLGNRNCGKGVLYELLGAFGDYVGAFPIANIMCERKGKGNETSRDLYWLMEFEFMRLAVSQEVPKECVNMKLKNELVKKICSGGDTQTARRNYDKRDTHFKVETSLFLMGNDPVQMEGDVLEQHIGFCSAIQFKPQEFIDTVIEEQGELASKKYRVADMTIKDLCVTPAWRDAFIQLIVDAFEDKPICVECSVSIANPIMTKFYEVFEITNDENDVIVGSDLEQFGRKIGSELKAIGVKTKKCEIKSSPYHNKICYYGIKRKTIENEKEPDDI